MTYHVTLVALGILRQADNLVLVQQQGLDDPHPYWVLPGGRVEMGELVIEALVREVREEAGVHITALGPLAYVTQIDHPNQAAQTLAFVFEVGAWTGSFGSSDSDNEILDVQLVPVADALVRLQAITWRGMREPLLAYLRGDAPPGALWQYRADADDQHLVASVPGAQ